MKILCVLGRYDYGDPARGAGHEFANFVPSFEALGHEVVIFDSLDRSSYSDFAELNAALVRVVAEETPDVMFSVLMHYEVWAETFAFARSRGCVAVNWTTDDSWRYRSFSRLVAGQFDAITTTYPAALDRYHQDGHDNALLTQWGVSPTRLHNPLPAAQCEYGVTFVGSAHGDRRKRIDRLRQHGLHIQCFGKGWEAGPVDADRIPAIFRSSVASLNFAGASTGWGTGTSNNQLKGRVFEVAGAGGCLITEAAPGLESFYEPGTEVLVFHDDDELIEILDRVTADHELRDSVARAGFDRTRRQHTYLQRFPEILTFALERAERHVLSPVRFETAMQHHRLNWRLRMLRSTLLGICRLFFGRNRAPRAARRIAFEISWRLVGDKTYRAGGWPGRMFYEAS